MDLYVGEVRGINKEDVNKNKKLAVVEKDKEKDCIEKDGKNILSVKMGNI